MPLTLPRTRRQLDDFAARCDRMAEVGFTVTKDRQGFRSIVVDYNVDNSFVTTSTGFITKRNSASTVFCI